MTLHGSQDAKMQKELGRSTGLFLHPGQMPLQINFFCLNFGKDRDGRKQSSSCCSVWPVAAATGKIGYALPDHSVARYPPHPHSSLTSPCSFLCYIKLTKEK